LSYRDVRTLLIHEIRAALRERNIVVYSLLIPAILYPLLIWLTWTAASFVSGQSEGPTSRIIAIAAPEHAAIVKELEGDPQIRVESPPEANDAKREAAVAAVRSGEVDAAILVEPPDAALEEADPSIHILFDSAKERSVVARERAGEAALRYREKRISKEGEARGVPKGSLEPLRIVLTNEASSREMGAFLLKLVVPLLLLVMTAMGCFYPAVDTTAGERERSTWETLMATGASRTSIIVAKYLYVAAFGCAAGLLNLTGMFVSMGAIFASAKNAAGGAEIRVGIPLSAAPIMILSAILIALFVSAVMMILASFARTFKEGQAMITPFYLAIALPAMLLQSPAVELTPAIACIPLANVTMMFREALAGTFKGPLVALTLVVQAAAIALALLVAGKLARFEDLLAGSPTISAWKLLRRRLAARLRGH
jgi:sodium transport system permease protein